MTVCGRRMQNWVLKFTLVWTAVCLASGKPAFSQADPVKIVGPNACAECHKEEALVWKKTHHFTTFKKMPRSKEARQIADKMGIKRVKSKSLCLNCHFTSQQPDAQRRPKPIAGISCESCHSHGREWEKLHAEFSGHKKKEDESKAEAQARWKKSEAFGMIRPRALYKLAKNCYSCHVVPQEDLVNTGHHPAGSKFELVAWSQGEVRHNLWYSKGKENVQANPGRRRIMYVVGLAVELETALRAVAVATKRRAYAVRMALRADAARKKMDAIAKAVANAPELTTIAKLSRSAGLKLKNYVALTAAADKIAQQTLRIVANYDGSTFGALDGMIPAPDKYKGKPAR